MNKLKKTLALVAALSMTVTAFASCGDDPSSSTPSSSTAESSTAESSAADSSDAGNEDSSEESSQAPQESSGEVDASVGQGGDTLTIAAWNADDVPYLIAQWKGIDYSSEDARKALVADLEADKVDGVHFISFGVGGGKAAENYDQLFKDGSDLDVYFCEADWALKYINDDSKTLDLAKLGLGDADFSNIYGYTDTIGMSESGVRKGISWQAAAGGFAYRADLAEEYLGAKTPDDMQKEVADWDKFVAAAQKVSEASSGSVALADSLGGLWQAYACGRTSPWVVNGVLTIDSFCEDFATTAKTLWDCNGVSHENQWDDTWKTAGLTGNTMGYFVSTWGFGGFFLDAAGGVGGDQYGKWALCEGPTPYYWGGTWIVVNPATDNGNEAREFIISATSDEAAMTEYAKTKPEYVNNKKVMDDLIAANTVFNEDVTGNFVDNQNIYASLADVAKQIDFNGLITPYDAKVKEDFITAVKEELCQGGKSWDDTKTRFEDDVLEHITDITVE